MRIAVTGAYGFSGKYIARRLLNLRHEVITLTNSPHRANQAYQHQAEQLPSAKLRELEQEAEKAADQINLDEAATRAIIDEQLRP